jgi:hypothetical protein
MPRIKKIHSQFGYYLAIEDDGACLHDAFESTTCYDRTFAILTCIAWGIPVTALAHKLSDPARRLEEEAAPPTPS